MARARWLRLRASLYQERKSLRTRKCLLRCAAVWQFTTPVSTLILSEIRSWESCVSFVRDNDKRDGNGRPFYVPSKNRENRQLLPRAAVVEPQLLDVQFAVSVAVVHTANKDFCLLVFTSSLRSKKNHISPALLYP